MMTLISWIGSGIVFVLIATSSATTAGAGAADSAFVSSTSSQKSSSFVPKSTTRRAYLHAELRFSSWGYDASNVRIQSLVYPSSTGAWLPLASSRSNADNDNSDRQTSESNILEEELERLQNQLSLIEALEERNKAQLESFVDEQDQWDSMDQEDRELLLQKDDIIRRLEILAEEVVQIWMGAKSMEG